MGKLFARVINDRLRAVVEDSVVDSQCGFKAGKGYGFLCASTGREDH